MCCLGIECEFVLKGVVLFLKSVNDFRRDKNPVVMLIMNSIVKTIAFIIVVGLIHFGHWFVGIMGNTVLLQFTTLIFDFAKCALFIYIVVESAIKLLIITSDNLLNELTPKLNNISNNVVKLVEIIHRMKERISLLKTIIN